ncbi:MAG: phosphocholine cytidylyltransferase family protein [Deltaproteobacteria bacterium]|nr:phosphocholine cytidylyltransferase family protein [Candidatus Anaeroferrophillacea bacterium]
MLSAGQGKRLLPLTAKRPKCMIPIAGRPLIDWQIEALLGCGVEEIRVVTGYAADLVEDYLAVAWSGEPVQTVFNPFYLVSDNLATCWVVRGEMDGDFILLNGDTIFRAPLLETLLAGEPRDVTVTTDRKAVYDDDDMKVAVEGDRLLRIGKDLAADVVGAESIGLLLFRGHGAALFRRSVEAVMRHPAGLRRWYLSVIDELARDHAVRTCCIAGHPWAEVDCPADIAAAARVVGESCGEIPCAADLAAAVSSV